MNLVWKADFSENNS